MGELNEHFAAMDISWAQELFTRNARASSVPVNYRRSAGADRHEVDRAVNCAFCRAT